MNGFVGLKRQVKNMKLYDITGYKAQYIKPNTNLIMYANFTNPFALINASLYNGVSTTVRPQKPIGTIIEKGKIVNNAGNGFGVGILKGSDKISFGNPWQNWEYYLTGYNSPVQNGKYVVPGFKDRYVFDCQLSRIGLGQNKAGKTFIVIDDYVTLKQFAENAIAQGIVTLVNLDGGASRHLRYNYKNIYISYRIPYNALAFYTELPKCPYEEPNIDAREAAKWEQWHLNRHGLLYGVDGIFGPNSFAALKNFQKQNGLPITGICDDKTREVLKQ